MAEEAIAGYGQAMRNIAKHRRKTQNVLNIFDTIGTVGTFAVGQAKKAKTAWEEYEAGYTELGGDPLKLSEKPGFFKQLGQSLVPGGQKGFFQKPEGEIKIGNKIYDMEQVRKLGGFAGSDIGAIAKAQGGDIFERYKEGLTPGRFETEEDVYQDIAKRYDLDPSKVTYQDTDRIHLPGRKSEAFDKMRGIIGDDTLSDEDILRIIQDQGLDTEGLLTKGVDISSKQPITSSIDPTYYQKKGRKIQEYDKFGSWTGSRDPGSVDVAGIKGKEFYKKDYFTKLSEWDRVLKKKNLKNLWDAKNENNKNRKPYE